MYTRIDNICEEALDAHGGRKKMESIKTKSFTDDIYLLVPPVSKPSAVVSANAESKPKRTPLLPSTRTIHLLKSGNVVRLRIETLSEFGTSTILINGNKGVHIVKLSSQMKKRFEEEGKQEQGDISVVPLSEGLVRGNLLSMVWETPMAFLLDYKKRNASYKGIREAIGGLTEVERGACHVLQFTGLQGSGIYELEVDTEEMLCRRLRIPMGMSNGELMYSDYRRVDNVMAVYGTKFLVDNNAVSISKAREIKFNVSLPDTIFSI